MAFFCDSASLLLPVPGLSVDLLDVLSGSPPTLLQLAWKLDLDGTFFRVALAGASTVLFE